MKKRTERKLQSLNLDSPERIKQAALLKDGWANVLTGLNVLGKDKKVSAKVEWIRKEEPELDELFSGDEMARKIVEKPVQEATKKGWTLIGLDQDKIDAIEKRARDLKLQDNIIQAATWARLYGGAGIMFSGGLLDDERRPGQKISSLFTMNKFELYPNYSDIQKDITKPMFGLPMVYRFFSRQAIDNSNVQIHHSNIIRFDGLPLPRRHWIQNSYWGDSVLNAIEHLIRNYQTTGDSMATIVQDFSTAVYKIKNLADMIGSDGEMNVIKRMELVNMAQSIVRAVVIDADGEDFEHRSRPVAGIGEVAGESKDRLVAGTDFPHTVLFGTSPAGGLGPSGNHELDNWYNYLMTYQTNYLKEKILQAYKMIAEELNIDFSKADLEFPPLYQTDEKEQADIRKLNADTDAIYIDRGVYSPEQVAESRFGSGKDTSDIELENDPSIPDITPVETTPVPGALPEPAATPAPAPAVDPAAGGQSIQAASMNGAQVTSLLQILEKVAMGLLPKASAKAIIMSAFAVEDKKAEEMIGPIEFGSTTPEQMTKVKLDWMK